MNKKQETAFLLMQNTLVDVLDYYNNNLDLPETTIIERVQKAIAVSLKTIKTSTGNPRPR